MSRARLIAVFPAVVAAALFLPCTPAQAEPKIEWRLENPFRFFTNPKHTEMHRKALAALAEDARKSSPVSSVERNLAEASAGRGWAEKLVDAPGGLGKSTEEERCWYQRADCSDYAKPKSHKVMVKVSGLQGQCRWRMANAPLSQQVPCDRETTLTIPYPSGALIAVESEGAEVAKAEIKVEDLLVVGLGDSFASGEGNPDKAVAYNPRHVLDYSQDDMLRGYPARAGGPAGSSSTSSAAFEAGRARWLNRGCHRSVYSQHLRAALQLAIADPAGQRSITYIGVGCTGGEVIEGLFDKWGGHEPSAAAEVTALSQLSGVSQAICGTAKTEFKPYNFSQEGFLADLKQVKLATCPKDKARKIDLVLLSVGGNDVGFSGLVARAALKLDGFSQFLADNWVPDLMITPQQAAARLKPLSRRYAALAAALRDVLHVDEPGRVLLSAYPLMATREDGSRCLSGRQGMDVTQFYGISRLRAETTERFVENVLTPVMRQAANDHGWTFVAGHRTKFKKHGLCAYTSAEIASRPVANITFPRRYVPKGIIVNPFVVAAVSSAPRSRSVPKALIGPAELQAKWDDRNSFSPDLFRPYSSKQRWFRTPNDAFLTSNYYDNAKFGSDLLALTLFAGLSGAFHPTAEGHAVMADALFKAAQPVLKIEP